MARILSRLGGFRRLIRGMRYLGVVIVYECVSTEVRDLAGNEETHVAR